MAALHLKTNRLVYFCRLGDFVKNTGKKVHENMGRIPHPPAVTIQNERPDPDAEACVPDPIR
jgi:hypothetical protein